jgi:hypothetical protein
MSEIEDIIKKLEYARDSSRDLDAEIFECLGMAPKIGYGIWDWKYIKSEGVWEKSVFNQPAPNMRVVAPRYTSSFDDAISLIPENFLLFMMGEILGDGLPMVQLTTTGGSPSIEVFGIGNGCKKENLIIAICIAALNAMVENKKYEK